MGAGTWIASASSAASRSTARIPISGAKNATLPLMIASLLTEETLVLDNVPRLADVDLLQRILVNHGVDIMVRASGRASEESARPCTSSARDIVDTTAPYDLVSKMRASFWVIAPLLARMGEAKVSLPGGCAIGTRPVDLLIMALEQLGAADRDRRRLRHRPRQERTEGRRDRVSQGDGRRHAYRADGGVAGARHDGDRERRAASPRSSTSPTASTRWARGSPAPAPRGSSSRA